MTKKAFTLLIVLISTVGVVQADYKKNKLFL